MRFDPLVHRVCVLALTAGFWPTTVHADVILLRDVRGLDGRAVITELDASGSVVGQNTATDSQQAVFGQPFERSMRVDAPLAAGVTASTLSNQQSTVLGSAGPLTFFRATGAAILETNIDSPRFTTEGSEAGSFYDVTFELLEPYRYQYNSFVERSHPEGLPSFSETRLSDSLGKLIHHLELFETGGFEGLSRSGVLLPGAYSLQGNARLFDFGADVSGRVQYSVELSLTPVPEPASMLLVGTGLFALATRGRSRTRRQGFNS